MSRKREATRYWKAYAKLKTISPLGFSVIIDEYKDKTKGKKVKEVRIDHFSENGKILFDIGKRMKGWIRQTLATVRGKTSVVTERSQHGLWAKSLPEVGFVEIGELSELKGLKRDDGVTRDLVLPEGISVYPYHEYGLADGGKRSFTAFYYKLPPPKVLEVEITSFVKGIDPEFIEELLRTVGSNAGLGDRHSQSGYGLFEVEEWRIEEERDIA